MRRKFLSVFQKFVQIESFSGFLLFGATICAMIWANSAYGDTYQSFWNTPFGIGSESFGITKPFILWVNDGLMAVFFFVIGLEIKRELMIGELNTIRKATFPLFAAIGGMLIPLVIFLLMNNNPETTGGWGIPMATDIAFALAILKLLGRAAPLSLKIFLTAFAIVDDLGAVLVIAVFYSTGIDWLLIGYSLILLALLFLLSYRDLYNKYVTLVLGATIWVLFLKSGIHPTIAGVLLAFTIPIRQKIDASTFVEDLTAIEDKICEDEKSKQRILTANQIEQIDHLEDLIERFQSPLQKLENDLHGWVAYFIMPVFALANAGIAFSAGMNLNTPLITNIAAALLVGKLIGIPLFSYLAVRLNLAELPGNIRFIQIVGVAIIAGVGFTMSIFIANLAFTENLVYVDSAKAGIMIGSTVSAILGATVLKISARNYVGEEVEE